MKRTLPFLLIGAGILLVLTGIGAAVFNRIFQNPEPAPLPMNIGGLPLVSRSGGLAALREVRDLHNQEFPLTSGAVGRYGLKGEATLWVAGAPFKWIASRMLQSMHDKIGEGNSPFTPVRIRNLEGIVVYELDGMGQKHFYFQNGKLIIWLAINEAFADQALLETLAFYR